MKRSWTENENLPARKKRSQSNLAFFVCPRRLAGLILGVCLVALVKWPSLSAGAQWDAGNGYPNGYVSRGGVAPTYSDEQIANAIFKAENSKTHPYGILAHYKHTTPRQACINTIRHARRDWDGKGDFIVFLGSRYCPIGAENDPTGLNKNWVRNVKYFLQREAK